MSFDLAIRLIEVSVGLAVLQRGAEHVRLDTPLFLAQIIVSGLLVSGWFGGWAACGLWALCVVQLRRFQGPYNGGSDKMVMLILFCLALVHLAPSPFWAELALSYLAVQLILSYVVSGWVKLKNPDWREGRALSDVFAFSAYPASDGLRQLADRPQMLLMASWAVIGFEVLFVLALVHPILLGAALAVAACFHLANAICFGLNRFLWAWISAYPALIWFQGRIFAG